MSQLEQDGRGDAMHDTRRPQDPRSEVSNPYRRLTGHLIVTTALAGLAITEALMFVSPAAPQAIPG